MNRSPTKKFVVIVPPGRFREALGCTTMPVAVARMCNWLQRERPDVECHIIDGHMSYGQPINEAGERKVQKKLLNGLDELVDDRTLVGFSTFANREIVHALPLARAIKERYGSPIVLGGYAASTCPDLAATSYGELFDGVVAGAGEQAAVALMDTLDGQRLVDRSRVPNLLYLEEGRLKVNPRLPPPRLAENAPLDLSMIVDVESYEMLPYFATTGCPHRCDFCFEPKLYPKYDKAEVTQILNDIDSAFEQWITPRYASFVDPLFGFDEKHTLELLRGIRERGIRFSMYTRADALTRPMFELMEGSCALAFLGLEAFTEEALSYMGKTKNIPKYKEKMRETARLAFEHGVTPQVGVIPNYPLNRQRDVDKIFSFFDELTELHESICPEEGPGFLLSVFCYTIWYGLPHFHELEQLEGRGMTWGPGFPDEYHGEPVNPDLRRDVRDASPEYSHAQFVEDRPKLYGRALRTPAAMRHEYDCYSLGFVNSQAGTCVRGDGKPLVWSDDDKDVLDMKSMYDERITNYKNQ